MPQVIPMATAWLAKNLTWAAVGKWLLTAAVTTAASYGIGRLVSRRSSGTLTSTSPLDLRLDVTAPRRVIYGECGVGGVLRFRHVAGTNNKYLYLILVWAGHPCEAVVALKADGVVVPLDGSGNATGTFAGVLRCTHHLGAHDQTADANFVAEIGSAWTSAHRLKGCTYSALRLEWNQDKFPTGLPQFTAVLRGRKVWDFRDEGQDPADPATWAWSDNVALCAADFIRGVPMLDGAGTLIRPFGIGAADNRLPESRWVGCANACAEPVAKNALERTCDVEDGNRHIGCLDVSGITAGMSVTGTGIPDDTVVVSVDGSGTFFTVDQDPTATNSGITLLIGETEPRYTCNGCFDTDASPAAVLDALAGAMAGKIVPIGSDFYPFPGVWQEPDFTLNETMLRGLPGASNPLPRRERINVVKGTFNNPEANYQRDDFPQIVSDAFIEEDGAELARDLDLAFTNSPSMAQRIGKIALLRSRQGIVTSWPCNLRALPALTGENAEVDSTEFGWSGKPFELIEFSLKIERGDDGGLGFVPDLVLQETDSSIYDWSTDEEETKDPAPNTTLPHPRTVAPPTSLTLTSGATTVAAQADGTVVPRLRLAWTAPADQAVISGGLILIEYKRSADSDWSQWSPVPGGQTFDFITDVVVGTNYDVRIRAQNNFGVFSAYATPAAGAHTIVGDATQLSAPTGLTATAGTGKAVSLDWDDVTDTRLGEYGVYRNTTNNPSTATKVAEVRASRFVDTDVNIGTTYYWWVTAITRSEVESTKSSAASATPGTVGSGAVDNTPPSNPAAATLNTSGTYLSGDGTVFSRLLINVPAMPSGAVLLNVLYRRNGTTGWIIADQRSAGGSTSSIDDLTPGVAYEVACQAFSVFGYGSNIVAATSSPFTAPNITTGPSAPASGSLSADGVKPKFFPGTQVFLFGTRVGWAPVSEAQVAYYEVKATTTNSDGATDYSWTPYDGVNSVVRTTDTECYLYNVFGSAGFVRVRAVNRTGVPSAWLSLGNANAAMSIGTGSIAAQGSDDVVTTGIRVGGGASTPKIIAIFDDSVVKTLTGGSPTEHITVSLSNCGFSAKPDLGHVEVASDNPELDAFYDFDHASNSASWAYIKVFSRDGSNIGAGGVRFSVTLKEKV